MRELTVADGTLAWDVVDLTPPWLVNPTTVILHHGLGTNADMWGEWLPQLAVRHRIVRFDMRGCGRSSALKPVSKLGLELFRDDVLAVADAADAPTLPSNRRIIRRSGRAVHRGDAPRAAVVGDHHLISASWCAHAHPRGVAGVGRRPGKHARGLSR